MILSKHRKQLLSRGAFWVLVILIMVFCLFPFYYALLTSFKVGQELFEVSYWFSSLRLENYENLFEQQNFLLIILNSVIVSFTTVAISMLIGISAAYALGRINFRGKITLMYLILGVSMFPQIAVLSGLYSLLQLLGLFNNLFGLSLTYMIFTLPFTVWVLTSFIKSLPKELEESAIMDGATPLQTIYHIFLPIIQPAVITTGLLAFIAAWNEFLFALTYTVNQKARTVQVAISLISGSSQYELPFGTIMAASVLVTVPLIIMVLIFQKRIVAGLTAGAVKG